MRAQTKQSRCEQIEPVIRPSHRLHGGMTGGKFQKHIYRETARRVDSSITRLIPQPNTVLPILEEVCLAPFEGYRITACAFCYVPPVTLLPTLVRSSPSRRPLLSFPVLLVVLPQLRRSLGHLPVSPNQNARKNAAHRTERN